MSTGSDRHVRRRQAGVALIDEEVNDGRNDGGGNELAADTGSLVLPGEAFAHERLDDFRTELHVEPLFFLEAALLFGQLADQNLTIGGLVENVEQQQLV